MEDQTWEDTHTPLHKVVAWDLATFGYLGRALPSKPAELLEIAREETVQRFLEPLSYPTGHNLLMAVGNRIANWSQKCKVDMALETPPYSESGSLITPRKIGGQARIWRDFLRVLSLVSREEGNSEKDLFGYHVDMNMGMDPDLGRDTYISYFGQGLAVDERYHTNSTLLSIAHWLDQPFLEHIAQCKLGNCSAPQMHYPYKIQALPETGWRARCASLPWPSIVMATELPRRAILRGAKKDRNSGPALGNFRGVEQVATRRFINSCDLLSATDYFSLPLQKEISEKIVQNWRGSIFEDFITASFSASRIVNDDYEIPKWPGLEYFIQRCTVPKSKTINETINDMYFNNPVSYSLGYQLRYKESKKDLQLRGWEDVCDKKNLPGIHFFPSTVVQSKKVSNMEFRRFLSKFGFNEPEVIGEPACCAIPAPYGKGVAATGTRVERSRVGFRDLGEDHRPVISKEKTVDKQITIDYDLSMQNAILAEKGLAKKILLEMRSWYRETFFGIPGRLSTNGQHMSLPLSWVALSAVTTTALSESQYMDKDLIAFTMGDDAIIGATRIDAIERYRTNLAKLGVKINYKKDMTSTAGRGVFCEYLFDIQRPESKFWVDIPRPKMITQPQEDKPNCRWLSVRDNPSKYYSNDQVNIIRKCKLSKYQRQIDEAIRYGYDPTVPQEWGGMGIVYENPNQVAVRKELVFLRGRTPEELVSIDHQLNKVTSVNPPYFYSTLLMQEVKRDMEYTYVWGRGALTTSSATQLIIEQWMPSFLYQPNFDRDTITPLTPKSVAESFRSKTRELWFKYGSGAQEMILDSEMTMIAKRRHDIRVKSPLLDELGHNALDQINFWKQK
jgi:hypothetical protein